MPQQQNAPPARNPKGWRFNNAVASPLGSITSAGFADNSQHGAGPARIFGQYAVVYVLDGNAFYKDAHGTQMDIGPGDMILVFPDLAHSYGPKGNGLWTSLWLSFSGKIFDLWREQGLLDDHHPVHHLEPVDVWFRRFDSILGAPRQTGYAPPLLEICRLQTLLAEIVTGAGRQTAYQDDLRWASQACAQLDATLVSAPDWESIARHLGTSPETFRKRFTRLVGHPPARYRAGRLVDRACELMQERRLTDKQIAAVLGFCDEYYFSRRFKQITGRSPTQFRALSAQG
ncbi:MAG: AraC family transcriptional regulator [Methylacidiphilales bacterium]|nr:AraC family transcriptional regulator [Candidatus Methylacidiphilales bacterium]